MTYSRARNFVAKSFLNVLNIITQMSLSPSPMLTQAYFVRAVRRLWYSKQHWGKKNDTSVSRNLTRVDDSKKLPLCSENKLCHHHLMSSYFLHFPKLICINFTFIKSALVKPSNKNLSLILNFSYSFIYEFHFLKIFQFFTTKVALIVSQKAALNGW